MPLPEELKPINVILVDDEQEACINLQNILQTYVDEPINIMAVAYNTRDAEQLVRNLQPDALFLDIEMPNENSFQFLSRISPFHFEVIFVTAYDEYAIKAFKLNAIDYILKPVSISELRTAIERLRLRLREKKILSGLFSYPELSELVYNRSDHLRIVLKNGNEVEVVEFKDIYFLEAQASYCRIVFLKNKEVKELTMSYPLSEYEDLLPADAFFRI